MHVKGDTVLHAESIYTSSMMGRQPKDILQEKQATATIRHAANQNYSEQLPTGRPIVT